MATAETLDCILSSFLSFTKPIPTPIALGIYLFSTTQESTKTPPQICAFPISGTYGPIPRYTYVSLQIISICSTILGRNSSATSVVSGITLCYSLSAAIHSFALFFTYQSHTIDLDIYPVFCITYLEVLCLRSTRLSLGRKLSRAIVGLFVVSAVMSVLAIAAVHVSPGGSSPCDSSLAMRKGQAASLTKIRSASPAIYISITMALALCYPISVFACTIISVVREPAPYSSNGDRNTRPGRTASTFISHIRYPTNTFKFLGHALLTVSILTIFDVEFRVLPHMPLSGSRSAIGEWGPVLGVLCAVVLPAMGRVSGPRDALTGAVSTIRAGVDSIPQALIAYYPVILERIAVEVLAFLVISGMFSLSTGVMVVVFFLYLFIISIISERIRRRRALYN